METNAERYTSLYWAVRYGTLSLEQACQQLLDAGLDLHAEYLRKSFTN